MICGCWVIQFPNRSKNTSARACSVYRGACPSFLGARVKIKRNILWVLGSSSFKSIGPIYGPRVFRSCSKTIPRKNVFVKVFLVDCQGKLANQLFPHFWQVMIEKGKWHWLWKFSNEPLQWSGNDHMVLNGPTNIQTHELIGKNVEYAILIVVYRKRSSIHKIGRRKSKKKLCWIWNRRSLYEMDFLCFVTDALELSKLPTKQGMVLEWDPNVFDLIPKTFKLNISYN